MRAISLKTTISITALVILASACGQQTQTSHVMSEAASPTKKELEAKKRQADVQTLSKVAPIDDDVLDEAQTILSAWQDASSSKDTTAVVALFGTMRDQGKLLLGEGDGKTYGEYDPLRDQVKINQKAMNQFLESAPEEKLATDETVRGTDVSQTMLKVYWLLPPLVHELTHALDERDHGFGRSLEEEERCRKLEVNLYSFLKDNYGFDSASMDADLRIIESSGWKEFFAEAGYDLPQGRAAYVEYPSTWLDDQLSETSD